MIPIKRLGLFALVIPFSKVTPANAVVVRARDVQCNEAQDLVENEGRVNFETSGDVQGELYVMNPDACGDAGAERAFIPTADSPACLVGYRCKTN